MNNLINNKKTGIDVSYAQGKINWPEVKKHIDFAIIRCGYGDNIESQDDAYWKYNADECTRLGIPFGVYIYSYAANDTQSRSEAEHVLRLIRGYKLSYPIYLDLEEETAAVQEHAVRGAQIFGDILEAVGYNVGIYANLTGFKTSSAIVSTVLLNGWLSITSLVLTKAAMTCGNILPPDIYQVSGEMST